MNASVPPGLLFGMQQSAYQPHGMCYLWEPSLVWTHVTADTLIALAYYSIPIGLVYLIRRRRDLPFDWMFIAFAVFILACGTTHLMAVWTLWNPDYWVSAAVKVVTAGASIATAALMIPFVPRALELSTPRELEERNSELRREISERRRVEARLAEQMGVLNNILHSMSEGVIVATTEGEVTVTNPAAERILQRGAPAVPPEQWPEHYRVYRDEDAEAPCSAEELTLVQALAGRETNDRVFYLRYGGDAPGRWVRSSGRPLRDEAGELTGAVTVIRDITQERENEMEIASLHERLRARLQEVSAVNDELEAFAHSVSHDLRAPLRSIEGFATALLEDCVDALDDPCRDYTRRIADSASRMGDLIQDLLEYSRLARAGLPLAPISLDRVRDAVLESLQNAVEEAGARVHIEGERELSVMGHEGTLFRVLANLVANAVTYVAPGATADITLEAERRDDRVRIGVRDNGIGIAPEHRERIFRVFERLHGRESYPGTGMGLAIVAKGMERMGGRVGVDSTPGEGSHFWIELEEGS